MRILVASILALLLLSGCLSGPRTANEHANAIPPPDAYKGPPHPEPLRDGPLSVRVAEYDQGSVLVGGRTSAHSNYSYDARLRGVLFVPDGDGPFPILLFLHGQHSTCGISGREAFVSSPAGGCEGPEPWHPYPNHRGYDYLGRHLASHGYVVASLLAKEINDRNGPGDTGMWARGELLIATLDMFKEAHEGDRDLGLAGRLDFSRIGLMGHSRGGEGVVTATHVNAERADPYQLGAIIALAPTDFNRRGVAGAALLSLVPYCDGDVYNLHGLRTYDHSRFLDASTAKVQILVHGANHNNYNTKWGKGETLVYRDGDDAPIGRHQNTECDLAPEQGGGRLSLEQTLREGLLHMAGFFRWVLGPEPTLGPYFTGEADTPPSACPRAGGACPGFSVTSALLPQRKILFNVTMAGIQDRTGQTTLEGFTSRRACSFTTCASNMYSFAWSMDLQWQSAARLTTRMPAGALSGVDALAFRIGVPTQGDANQPGRSVALSTLIVDAQGQQHVVSFRIEPALRHPPGETADVAGATVGMPKVSLNMVRVPLSGLGITGDQIREVHLLFDGGSPGRVFLSEMYAQREGGPALYAPK